MPEWEEMCATAAAVQNMHIQAGANPRLACYWSSWHAAFTASKEMKDYLGVTDPEDRCLGIFCVATCDPKKVNDGRKRSVETHLSVDWRD